MIFEQRCQLQCSLRQALDMWVDLSGCIGLYFAIAL
jgi:hypothetical protein